MVTVRYADGFAPPPLPPGWAADDAGDHRRLACQRESVHEGADDPITALIDFELIRDPDRPNKLVAQAVDRAWRWHRRRPPKQIARDAGVGIGTVQRTRRRLAEAGKVKPWSR